MKRLIAVGAVLTLATGCAAGVGAGVGAALIAAGVLTHECYEYVTITVIDGATGAKTCAAKVTVSEGGDDDVLGSCYYAPLTAGSWKVRAELAGRQPAVVTMNVEERDSCEPAVGSLVLTIPAPGGPLAPQPAVPTPAPGPAPSPPVTTAPETPPPPTAPVVPSGTPTPPEAVPAPSAAPAPAAPEGVPPTQRFPD
jgi:hypothetical protein